MNVAKLLEERRVQWSELESICDKLEVRGKLKSTASPSYQGAANHHAANHHGAQQHGAQGITRFSSLYRSACADLALADAYQLPPATVTYLHRLVARAHNQLYRADRIEPSGWFDIVFNDAPKQIFADPCVRIATLIFFGLFSLSVYVGYNQDLFPGFAESMVGTETIEQMEEMYEKPIAGSMSHYASMASFYIRNNTGIGLQCFAFGILILPCVFILAYNAVVLGTVFGYMAREDVVGSENFYHFVTAHGPFELTAIALSAAAGLRLGVGFFSTKGLTRLDSIRVNARQAVPVMSAAAVLFVLAAFTEGFLSPSPAPYLLKAGWAIFSAALISFYFVVLGFPRDAFDLRRDDDDEQEFGDAT